MKLDKRVKGISLAAQCLLEVGKEVQERYKTQAIAVNSKFLLNALKTLSEADVRYKNSNNARLLVELALLELVMLWQKTNSANSGEKKKPELNLGESPQPSAPPASHSAPQAAPIQKTEIPKAKPVAEEPALTPNTRVTELSSKVPENAQEEKAKPQVQTESKLKRKRSSGAFSINQTLSGDLGSKKKQTEEEEEDLDKPVEGKPQNPFDQEGLKTVWDAFVEKAKGKGLKIVVATLANKELKILENSEVQITLDNTLQAQTFQDIKRELLYFCREKLQNFALHFTVNIVKGSQKLVPYSAPEKYQYLLDKNPNLAKLREQLGLDIE